LLRNVLTKHSLSFNIPNIDDLFHGFTEGDFASLYGASSVLSLSFLLAVRAQLPFQLGGLETNVVFIDGGNTFRLYQVSYIARLHELNPRQVLKRIFVSRAFTAHQLTSLILEKLEETVERFSSKIVIISDMTELFLDKDVPRREALDVFNHLTLHLSKFAREKQVIVMATCYPQYDSRRNTFLKAVLCGRANVVLSVRQSKHERQLVLEKHPVFDYGYAGFPSEHLTLDQYLEA
jgi:RecA/RadA recombinase